MPARRVSQAGHSADVHRMEIERRTLNGESCEQIANALRTRGVEIHKKTIWRRRIEWGLRDAPNSVRERFESRAEPRQPKKDRPSKAAAAARRAQIEAWTRAGETAETIAEALQAQGIELKKGASTVQRLQSVWGLIEPGDRPSRAKNAPPREKREKVKVPKVSKREMEREANKQQQTQTLHYPTNCNFGPKKRANGGNVDVSSDDHIMDGASDNDMPIIMDNGDMDDSTVDPVLQPSAVDVGSELMSVELLVDLAGSTLQAATNLKEMLKAYQASRPVAGSLFAPTLEDLSTARKKVKEAAIVMYDMADEPGAGA